MLFKDVEISRILQICTNSLYIDIYTYYIYVLMYSHEQSENILIYWD
jgi:hypothetical protein